jgi:hypothetical protein
LSKDTRPYFTVTNELFRHPKWTGLPNDKSRIHLLELWGHCNEFRTDGAVAKHVLHAKGPAVAKALIAGGWVNTTKDPNKFEMHDYLSHQPSKAEIEARIQDKQASGKEGGKRSAHKRWHVDRGVIKDDCELCEAEFG